MNRVRVLSRLGATCIPCQRSQRVGFSRSATRWLQRKEVPFVGTVRPLPRSVNTVQISVGKKKKDRRTEWTEGTIGIMEMPVFRNIGVALPAASPYDDVSTTSGTSPGSFSASCCGRTRCILSRDNAWRTIRGARGWDGDNRRNTRTLLTANCRW